MMFKKTILILFIVAGCFYTCTKDEFEGPSIEALYGDFKIVDSLKLTNSNPNFSLEENVGFYCKFNKDVNWKITIRGNISNSVKELSGFSNTIDSTTITWTGNTSEMPFFQEEKCEVKLTFDNEKDTLVDSLTIAGTKIYDGILIADFENGTPENSIVFKQSSMNMTFETASDNPLVGDNYFKMGGRMGWNEWLLGQIDIPLNLSDVSSTPENFYLNLGILSGVNGELASDQYINILISESNSPFNGDLTNNGADVFKDTMEVYKYQIRPVDWIGWKYIAVGYDEFEVKSAGGDNIKNPKNIKAIRIQCQSCPSASGNCPSNASIDVRTDIDYVIFTENEKLLDQE